MPNADDVCTSLGLTAIELVNGGQDPPLGTPSISIGAGSTTAAIANQPLAVGDLGLTFTAPLAGNTGYADMVFDLSLATGADLEWLRYDWNGDGSHDEDPAARATFGVYSGSAAVIYIREPW